MINITVNWSVRNTAIPNASAADHFVVTLGTTEVSEPLTARSHTFSDVEAAAYQGAISLVDAGGVELVTPTIFTADASGVPVAPVPASITVDVKIQ